MGDHGILSIDIGVTNLGYTLMVPYDGLPIDAHSRQIDDFNLEFGIYDITRTIRQRKDFPQTVVTSRIAAIKAFFEEITSDGLILDYIVIERQVNTNTVAMELMYAITGIGASYIGSSNDIFKIIIFDPKMKFTAINEQYKTVNKQHKRQSIMFARNVLVKKYPNEVKSFMRHEKQDDIADSLNQLLVFLMQHNYISVGIHELRELMLDL